MTDKENIKMGLEEVSDFFFEMYKKETDEYKAIKAKEYCDIAEDAIALLKEQEPKTVQSITTVGQRTYGYCPSCGRGLDSYQDGNSGEHITHFCYNCGQAVKWE